MDNILYLLLSLHVLFMAVLAGVSLYLMSLIKKLIEIIKNQDREPDAVEKSGGED